MEIIHRAYQGEEDDQRIRAFLRECYLLSLHPFYSMDPPNWERLRISLKINPKKHALHLWQLADDLDKKLVGLVHYKREQAEFSCLVHPYFQQIDQSLYEWVEREHKRTRTKQGD